MLPEVREIDEIWVRLALNPSPASKIRMRRPPDIGGPHIDNYQTAEVENPCSRYDIVPLLVANCNWVEVWLSDPKVPGVLGSS